MRSQPGYIIDSALPPAELLRRFRVGADSVARLSGASSREALVRRFFALLEKKDSAALRRLAITRAEFAWIVFPGSRLSLPPYRQPPDVAWMLGEMPSNSGFQRLLNRLGGQPLQYTSHECQKSEQDGRVTVHSNCTVRVFLSGEWTNARLFGGIVEHNGRFKLSGFANQF